MASPFEDLGAFREGSIPAPSLDSLQVLDETRNRALFILNAWLQYTGKWDGVLYHQLLGEWLKSGVIADSQLQEWLQERAAFSSRLLKFLDPAREQADRWLRAGLWGASWNLSISSSEGAPQCPQVLFGRGSPSWQRPSVAFFNSRKPRLFSPDAAWLSTLRTCLPLVVSKGAGLLSSLGTMTYDLVTAYACESEARLLLLAPSAIEHLAASGTISGNELVPQNLVLCTMLSCLTQAVDCSKTVRMTCRDRLIALLADFQCLLEISPKGNIFSILSSQQCHSPRIQWISRTRSSDVRAGGNAKLLQTWPGWAKPFEMHDIGVRHAEKRAIYQESTSVPGLRNIVWGNYLYHYTRACPGPWPTQSYRDYLMTLLHSDPMAGHTALDTLMRILAEGYIRASSRNVRGTEAVVCWSAISPMELKSIRHWNRALIQWTFEPFGIAISRSHLRLFGAKPAIYGRSELYERLKPSERYRFQRHEPPRCLWKHEREWRSRKDFPLLEVPSDHIFVFVPGSKEAEKLRGQAAPVVSLSIFSQ